MTQQPQSQPIMMLSVIAEALDEMLESAQGQLINLEAVRLKPYVLDNHTIQRLSSAYTTQQDDLRLFDEQLGRWSAQPLDDQQRREVEHLVLQLASLRSTITSIVTIAAEVAQGTIEKTLRKSDAELVMDALRKRPDRN